MTATVDATVEPVARSQPRQGRLRLALTALAVFGWAFGAVTLILRLDATGGLIIGDDLDAYLRAADDFIAGNPVYIGEIGQYDVFSYAPPWVVLFGALSWMPDLVMQVAIIALGVLCIRYIAGSWLWAGLAFLYPLSLMVLLSGNIEWFIAASLVLAARGRAEPLAFIALAKVAPIFGVRLDQWRQVLLVLVVAFLVTLPWLHLWPEWIEHLLRQPSSIAIHIGPPWYMRLPFALALLILRRPWARALAVVVAMPSMWLGTFVILAAPLRLWIDGRSRSDGV